jgi:hypothetical protein
MLGAAAMALLPTYALAAPGGGTSSPTAQPQTPVAQGQPNQSCQDVNGGNTGPYYPGHTETAPGSAFNETNGIAGGMYAGSQPQNSNNPASVAQYDVACFNQLQH